MKTLRAWIEAVRLRTIPVSVAGVFTAWACSFIDGNFNPIPAVLCLFFAILCQVASNFANEYYDYKAGRDRRGREGLRRRGGGLRPRPWGRWSRLVSSADSVGSERLPPAIFPGSVGA